MVIVALKEMSKCMILLNRAQRKLVSAFGVILLGTTLLRIPAIAQSDKSGIPEAMLPEGVGVNTHFITGGTVDHDMIATAGLKFIRQDFFWYLIETVKGQYDWANYDTLMEELNQRGIRALVTLNLNNILYASENRWGPTDTANINAYARFAAAAASRYESSHCLWEIWNEPNAGNTWHPAANATDYANLALAACKAIRTADSNAFIVAPAEAGVGTSFLKTIFQAGLLQYLNAVSVHPYRDGPPPRLPETVGSDFQNIKALIAQYAPPGRQIVIISGEWGYSTCNLTTGVSLLTQADYFARMNLYNLYCGVPLTIWYDWKNDGTDPAQIGQNRGLVTSTLALKPSYVAATVLTHELSGYSIDRLFNTGSNTDVVLVLTNGSDTVKTAAWTQGSAHNVVLALSALSLPDTTKTIWWIDSNGDEGTIGVAGGNFAVNLNSTPKYISAVPPVPISISLPAPSMPTLISPGPSEANIVRKPTFQWNQSLSAFAIQYRIQVASDSALASDGSFASENVVVDTTVADTSLQVLQALDSARTYSWHVCAFDLGGVSSYSAVFSFKTGSVVAFPFKPIPVSPPSLSTGTPRLPTLTWNVSNYAEEYNCQLASNYQVYTGGDSIGMFKVQNIVLDTTLSDTSVHVSILLDSTTVYFWHVKGVNTAGASDYSTTWKFTTGTTTAVREQTGSIPKEFALLWNYPNPFNPSTTIDYQLPRNSHVMLRVFDLLGREVATLVNGQQDAGYYKIKFHATRLASGVYFYVLRADSFIESREMILLK
jgi:polysaccharide biosynthesis protein PslG